MKSRSKTQYRYYLKNKNKDPYNDKNKKKFCSKCNNLLPITSFTKDKYKPDGVYNFCKKCAQELRRSRFGFTAELYNKTYLEQEGKCAMCGKSSEELGYDLCADHDHITGKPRGLLCKSCNLILGNCKDNPTILENGIIYLRKYGSKNQGNPS